MDKKKKITIIATHDYGKTTLADEAIKCGLSVVSKIAVCQYCKNELCDAQAFNHQCFKCGKKPF